MKQSLSITESKKQFSHELYYGKEYKLEQKVNEEDQVRFDILWKKNQSLRVVCGNDRCITKNHMKSLKEKWYWFLEEKENFIK